MIAATRLDPAAHVLGARIDGLGWREALATLSSWATRRESRTVFISNVHRVVTARQEPDLAEAMRQADMATPDGAPIAWMLRRLGFPNQPR